MEKDLEELQCIAANLIVRDYVKGYVSFAHNVVVVAKGTPFPPASERWLKDPF